MSCYAFGDVVQRAGLESAFKTKATTFDVTFGANVSLESLNGNNNVEKINTIGSRLTQELIKLGFEGTWGTSGMLADATLIRLLFDTANKTGSEETGYTMGLLNDGTLRTLTIQEGYNKQKNGATEFELRSALGCVPQTIRVSCNAGETVSISYDGVYANEEKEDLAYADESAYRAYNVTLVNPIPYTFVDAELTLGGATVGITSSINFSIVQEIELVYGLNSRTAQCLVGKLYSIEGGFVLPTQTMEIISRFYDATTTGTSPSEDNTTLALVMNFQKPDGKQIQITFNKIILGTYETDTRVNERKNHTLSFVATDATAFVKDETL